jgi:hypothetical protein
MRTIWAISQGYGGMTGYIRKRRLTLNFLALGHKFFWALSWWVLVSIAGFAQALIGLSASRSPSSQTAHLLLNDKMERIQQCLVIAL